MSTDSLQRPDSSPLDEDNQGKRKKGGFEAPEGLGEDGPSTKKCRVSGHYERSDRHTISDSGARVILSHDLAENTGVKKGWEGIDPELFAQFGDIVDIVEPE